MIGIEKSSERLAQAKKNCPNATFMGGDLLSKKMIENLIFQTRKRYDLVIANPPFDLALQFLLVAFTLLRLRSDGSKGRAIFLLPSDFFEASVKRSRIYNLMDWSVVTEYKLGHLSFYAHNRRAEKKSVDSLFIIQKGREGKFQHTVINARSAGMLSIE